MAESLAELLAESSIRALHLRYCRAADRLDQNMFRSCFHDDAVFEFPVYTGGVEGFLDMAWGTLAGFEVTRHFVGNQLVEIRGDHAWAEHYTVASHRMKADDHGPRRDYVANVRYVDQLERRTEWRIVRRLLLVDMSRTDAVPNLIPAPRPPDGKRDRSDPSYMYLAALGT